MQKITTDFLDWVKSHQDNIETRLAELLPAENVAPEKLHSAMRYAVLGGGKRVRPLLAFAAGELVNAKLEQVAYAAAAVELIHVYSLVHDDLPCMDDDILRRGKPTCYVKYDEATALLVGDSLQSLAFQLISQPQFLRNATAQLQMVNLLASASGSYGMAGGQDIDLASVGKTLSRSELESMHSFKTGALIKAAILMGAYCGDHVEKTHLIQLGVFADRIGLTFQVVDDVLDAEATTEKLGKTAGKDAQNNKPTYVSLMGVGAAKEFAKKLHSEATQALQQFGEQALRLRQIADFIVYRDS